MLFVMVQKNKRKTHFPSSIFSFQLFFKLCAKIAGIFTLCEVLFSRLLILLDGDFQFMSALTFLSAERFCRFIKKFQAYKVRRLPALNHKGSVGGRGNKLRDELFKIYARLE
jgi:hypothetical protein